MEEMILTSQRNEGIEVNSSINSQSPIHQSQKLLEKEALVGKSQEKLENAKRSALEIENTSKNVMIDLESQTQKLNNIQGKIVSLNGSIDSSSSIIARIMNREHRNKALIGMFSVTLVTLFIFILCSRS
jgi:TolA-binding protein